MSRIAWIGVFAALVVATGSIVYLTMARSDETEPETAQTETPAPAVEQRTVTEPTPAQKPQPVVAEKPAPKKVEAPKPVVIAMPQSAVDFGKFRALIANRRWAQVRSDLSQAYFADRTTEADRNKLEPLMLEVSARTIFENPTEDDFHFYKVQSGDSLIKIAYRFRTQYGYKNLQYGIIKMFNKMKKNFLRVGQKLRIPRGEVSIVVRKSSYKLFVFFKGIAFKSYNVAIGAEAGSTPVGLFTVADKTAKPTWWPPESAEGFDGPIGPDDPRNPLGTHWIALHHEMHTGLGIHGTNDPNSIGSRASLGCIRMRNRDVKFIFELANPGMECRIFN